MGDTLHCICWNCKKIEEIPSVSLVFWLIDHTGCNVTISGDELPGGGWNAIEIDPRLIQ